MLQTRIIRSISLFPLATKRCSGSWQCGTQRTNTNHTHTPLFHSHTPTQTGETGQNGKLRCFTAQTQIYHSSYVIQIDERLLEVFQGKNLNSLLLLFAINNHIFVSGIHVQLTVLADKVACHNKLNPFRTLKLIFESYRLNSITSY